jgi:hypothetical protein
MFPPVAYLLGIAPLRGSDGGMPPHQYREAKRNANAPLEGVLRHFAAVQKTENQPIKKP